MATTAEGPHPRDLPLVGLIEIAQRAGVARPTVSSWRMRDATKKPRFPEPVAELAVGPMFWWPAVEEWLHATGRRSDVNLTREQVSTRRTKLQRGEPAWQPGSPTKGRRPQ